MSNPHTAKAWSAASRGYAHVADQMMVPFAPDLIARLKPDNSMSAIEVAAGTGALTLQLAPQVHSLLATDFAPSMVEVLDERLAATSLNNVTTKVMDGMALSAGDGTFERAASSFAIMLFPDRAKGLSELHRVLKTDGRAALSAWAGPDEFEAFDIFLQGLKVAFPDMPPPPAPPAVFSLADPATFTREMEAAGFEEVFVDKVSRDMSIGGFDALWELLTSGAPPIQVLFDRVGPAGKEKLEGSVRAVVRERYGDGPFTITNTATIGSGIAR